MSKTSVSKAAIIVAGGSGKRMLSETPKQFLILAGRPVLQHTIQVFHRYDANMRIVVVLPEEHINTWKELCTKHKFTIPHEIVAGGKERFNSVKNALGLIKDHSLVAIHDGVRPLVDLNTIERSFSGAAESGSAIPYLAVSDTLRKVDASGSTWVNRSNFVRIQTPQCFETKILINAYNQDFSTDFTDDASVVEKAGHKITLVLGNEENIKITQPADLKIAEALMAL